MPFFKHVVKNKLSKYFWFSFWDSHFLAKKRSFQLISLKMVQNNRKHSLVVCCLISGEKKGFFLIFVAFYGLYKKGCLQKIQIFHWICPFSNLLRKTNFLSISEFLSERVTFLKKKRSFQWISPKMHHNNRKAYFCGMWLS